MGSLGQFLDSIAENALAHRDAEAAPEAPPLLDPTQELSGIDWDMNENPDGDYAVEDPEDWLSGLDEYQRAAAAATERAVYVIAGPGAGKTRVITHRLAWLYQNGITGLRSCTFTRKATNEMHQRLKAMGGQAAIGTLHNLSRALLTHCNDVVPELEPADGFALARKEGFKFLTGTTGISLMDAIVKQHNLPRLANAAESRNPYADAVSRRKAYGHAPAMTEDEALRTLKEHVPGRRINWIEIAYALYQAALLKRNAFDFDDQVIASRYVAERYPDMTYEFLASTEHLLIDEWQDTSFMQYCMVQALTVAKPALNVFAVGDEDQSIYGFRGADVRNAQRLIDDMGAQTYVLRRNYRSRPDIVSVSQSLIRRNKHRIDKTLEAVREADGRSVDDLIGGSAANVDLLARRYGAGNVAFISRRWKPVKALAEVCETKDIPFTCERFLRVEETALAKDCYAVLRMLTPGSEWDDWTIKRLAGLSGPLKGYGEAFLEKWPLNETTVKGRVLKRFLAEHASDDEMDMGEWLHWYFKAKFSKPQTASDIAKQRMKGLARRIDALGSFRDRMSDKEERPRGVTLTTSHSAKGLEFPVVVVLAYDFPHPFGDVEEERRLLYVAMTRAQDRLLLSGKSGL